MSSRPSGSLVGDDREPRVAARSCGSVSTSSAVDLAAERSLREPRPDGSGDLAHRDRLFETPDRAVRKRDGNHVHALETKKSADGPRFFDAGNANGGPVLRMSSGEARSRRSHNRGPFARHASIRIAIIALRPAGPKSAPEGRWPYSYGDDHRRPRPLHDRAAGAARLSRTPARRDLRPGAPARGARPGHRRRGAHRKRPAAAAAPEGARLGPHDLLAARRRNGAPRGNGSGRNAMGAGEQRPHPPHLHAAAGALRGRGPAAAVSRRAAGSAAFPSSSAS